MTKVIMHGCNGAMGQTITKIAKEKGILKSGAVVECGGMDLDGLGCIHRHHTAIIFIVNSRRVTI